MLVLSRRTDQKIVFPNVGITLQVLNVRGNVAKIGIEAPREIPVLRQEIVEQSRLDLRKPPGGFIPRKVRHDIKNRLNSVTLALHLLRKQLEAGQTENASGTFEKLLDELSRLDRQVGELGRGAEPSEPGEDARAALRKALVVEDEANEREMLAGFLRLSGCEVATAGDGAAALDYLCSHAHPDVVLLDMRMPRCDGPKTIEMIRRNPELAGLKVFAVSGSTPDEMGIATGPQGVDRWFIKPLDPERLINAMYTGA